MTVCRIDCAITQAPQGWRIRHSQVLGHSLVHVHDPVVLATKHARQCSGRPVAPCSSPGQLQPLPGLYICQRCQGAGAMTVCQAPCMGPCSRRTEKGRSGQADHTRAEASEARRMHSRDSVEQKMQHPQCARTEPPGLARMLHE